MGDSPRSSLTLSDDSEDEERAGHPRVSARMSAERALETNVAPPIVDVHSKHTEDPAHPAQTLLREYVTQGNASEVSSTRTFTLSVARSQDVRTSGLEQTSNLSLLHGTSLSTGSVSSPLSASLTEPPAPELTSETVPEFRPVVEPRAVSPPKSTVEEGGKDEQKVKQLVQLLERATTQIKAERTRAKELEKENELLKQQLASQQTAPKPDQSASDYNPEELSRLQAQNAHLKRTCDMLMVKVGHYNALKERYKYLLLENQLAVEQIAVLRIKCIDLQVALDDELSKFKHKQLPSTGGVIHTCGTVMAPHPTDLLESSTKVARPPWSPPPRSGTYFDRSPRRAPSPDRAKAASQTPTTCPTPTIESLVNALITKSAEQKSVTSSETKCRVKENAAPVRCSSADTCGRRSVGSEGQPPTNKVMIHRMIRALSPPPSPQQMGKLVDSMVQELRRTLISRGIDLSMTRTGACSYSLNGHRYHLSVVSDKLMVKVGGGYLDFLEFLCNLRAFRSFKQK